MRKFSVASHKHDCEIIFTYSSKGILTGFEVTKELPVEVLTGIISTAFYNLEDLQQAYKAPKLRGLLVELIQVIDFKEFWEKYNYQFDKKRALDVWNKLSVQERQRAFDYIEVYDIELSKSGIAKMYAKTFLKNKVWNV